MPQGTPGIEQAVSAQALAPGLEKLFSSLAKLMQNDAVRELKLGSLNALMAYLSLEMGNLRQEHFRVLFLDSSRCLLAERDMWKGTVDKVQVHPREVVREALMEAATSIIVVHNHVSGSPSASHQDIEMTRALMFACMACDIELTDHLIVSRRGAHSMRAAGTLQRFESEWQATSFREGSLS